METQENETQEGEVQERSGYTNMLFPPMEDLVSAAGSKFLLVSLVAKRTNDINTYYQGLGSGLANVAPPQIGGDYSSYLSIAFEEIAQGVTVLTRESPEIEEDILPSGELMDSEADGAEVAGADTDSKANTTEG